MTWQLKRVIVGEAGSLAPYPPNTFVKQRPKRARVRSSSIDANCSRPCFLCPCWEPPLSLMPCDPRHVNVSLFKGLRQQRPTDESFFNISAMRHAKLAGTKCSQERQHRQHRDYGPASAFKSAVYPQRGTLLTNAFEKILKKLHTSDKMLSSNRDNITSCRESGEL